ncbi:recombinase family protein [Mediterraneibacter gnavus]
MRDIFRKRLEGFSASHIADELNRLGILSPLAYKRNHGMPHAKVAIQTERIANGLQLQSSAFYRMKLTPEHWSRQADNAPFQIKRAWRTNLLRNGFVWGTHEAIIQKHDFDLVERLRRIDTRTSPKSDKVTFFPVF